jgi:hypothetical protein
MIYIARCSTRARVASTVSLLALILGAVPASAACYSGGVIAGGNKSAVTKHRAQEKARASWNHKAQSLMGTSRANWGNSNNRSYYCHHSFVWHCTAYARPCV